MLRAQGLGGEAELTASFNAARDREYGDIITGYDDAADAPEAMAAACDFRYEQLCGKQAGLDQLAGCYRALLDRDLPPRQAGRGGGGGSSPRLTSSQPQAIRDRGTATTIELLDRCISPLTAQIR